VRRLLIIAAIAAGTAAVAGVVIYGQMHMSLLTDRRATPIKAADRKAAPAFDRTALSGEPVDLQRFAGKPVVINFFASWCVPCRQEAAGLARLGEDFGPRVQMLGIAIDDKRPAATRFAREHHWTWPIVFDPSDDIAYRYDLTGKPTTVILDQRGRIAWLHMGKIGTRPVRQVLDALL
jgi:cytochrome c biogenesis protein CcmG, thiol:disulfide interchange protein DsbE